MSQTIANYSINGANPSTVGGTGTAIKYFPNLPGPSINVNNTTPSATSAAGQLLVPGNNQLNGQPFTVLASGNILAGSGGGSTTITVAIYANTGTVASPTYTTLGTGAFSAEVLDNVAYPFSIKLDMEGDTLSGIVQGTQQVLIDNVVETSTAALTHALTGINFATNPPFGLVCGVTFGTSESGNSANLYRFSIEA